MKRTDKKLQKIIPSQSKELIPKIKKEPHESFAITPLTPISYEGEAFDILLHAYIAKLTVWLSPASLGMAMFDWLSHLIISPAKQFDLCQRAWKNLLQFNLRMASLTGTQLGQTQIPLAQPKSNDHRFKNEAWNEFPFNLFAQSFLLVEELWDEATSSIRGVSKHHEQVVSFVTRQTLDMFSPSNYQLTNPEVLSATFYQGGMNLIKGFNNFIEDTYRATFNMPPVGTEKFKVGVNVAITPGKVVFRNRLIELIQYEPQQKQVFAEPILLIPAWIMKYYILDLSPNNSLVKYLVEQGHTVFMVSWKNPESDDRNLDLEDYLHYGIMEALDAINQVVPDTKVHAAGYCLGGTLLAIAAAHMANLGDERLKTMTLFAAQIDFRDPGEMSLFIDQSQITYLEDVMWEKGYLDGAQMAWAFSMLRSNDLIWSRMIHDYLLGKRRPINDLIAWDYDTTRLPYKMHSQYLRSLFLNNDLVYGRFSVGKKRIALTNINVPVFVVSTVKDHVSPWRSVYKIHLFTNTDITFVLTHGGHNAGIVSEPGGHPGRTYQMNTRLKGSKHISSDSWHERAPQYEGSWWPAWQAWLENHSSGKIPIPTGDAKKELAALCDAPGTYVFG